MMEPAKRENLDRILGVEEELAPSSGFVSAVMERVREEAAAPKPIPFPWKRVMPAIILVAAGLVWCAVQLVWMGTGEVKNPVLITLHPAGAMVKPLEGAAWVAAALGVSLLSWLLSRRLIGQGGMV